MHNVSLAEWFLSLVMSREQAASTAGDLIESASSHRAGWFWICLLRILAASVTSGLRTNPVRVLTASVCGFLLQFLTVAPGLYFGFMRHEVHGWDAAALLGAIVLAQAAIAFPITKLSGRNPLTVCFVIGILNCLVTVKNGNVALNGIILQIPLMAGMVLAHGLRRPQKYA